VQFKKAIANLDLSSEDTASLTVFIHLENDSYGIFDGMLMNPHLSPFTAHTNLALQATVDLLIQQAVLGQSPSAGSLVPSAFTSLTTNNGNSSPVPVISSSTVAEAPVLSSQSMPLSTSVVPLSSYYYSSYSTTWFWRQFRNQCFTC